MKQFLIELRGNVSLNWRRKPGTAMPQKAMQYKRAMQQCYIAVHSWDQKQKNVL